MSCKLSQLTQHLESPLNFGPGLGKSDSPRTIQLRARAKMLTFVGLLLISSLNHMMQRLNLWNCACPRAAKFMMLFKAARSMAAKLLLLGVAEADLSSQELVALKPYLVGLLCAKAIYGLGDGDGSAEDIIHKSIAGKMAAADRQRPDIPQLYIGLDSWAQASGSKLNQHNLMEYIDKFNSKSNNEGKRISLAEIGGLEFYASLSDVGKQKVDEHLSQFRQPQSALTVRKLDEFGRLLKDPEKLHKSAKNELWTSVFLPTVDKRDAAVFRLVGIFANNIKQQSRLKNNFNLQNQLRMFAEN